MLLPPSKIWRALGVYIEQLRIFVFYICFLSENCEMFFCKIFRNISEECWNLRFVVLWKKNRIVENPKQNLFQLFSSWSSVRMPTKKHTVRVCTYSYTIYIQEQNLQLDCVPRSNFYFYIFMLLIFFNFFHSICCTCETLPF